MNQGVFRHEIETMYTSNEFFTIFKNASKHSVWKTTTAANDSISNVKDPQFFIDRLKQNGISIFDAYKITKEYAGSQGRSNYWDVRHFQHHVYRALNIQLLQLLSTLIKS